MKESHNKHYSNLACCTCLIYCVSCVLCEVGDTGGRSCFYSGRYRDTIKICMAPASIKSSSAGARRPVDVGSARTEAERRNSNVGDYSDLVIKKMYSS